MFLALISVMSVRAWEDARKSKILWISQKGKKKLVSDCSPRAGTGALGVRAGLPFPSCPICRMRL